MEPPYTRSTSAAAGSENTWACVLLEARCQFPGAGRGYRDVWSRLDLTIRGWPRLLGWGRELGSNSSSQVYFNGILWEALPSLHIISLSLFGQDLQSQGKGHRSAVLGSWGSTGVGTLGAGGGAQLCREAS